MTTTGVGEDDDAGGGAAPPAAAPANTPWPKRRNNRACA